MKQIYYQLTEIIPPIWLESRRKNLPRYFLLLLSLNLVLAPVVQAATEATLSRGQSYALTLLGLVTFSLFIYLFVVILQPEKF